MSPGKIPVNVGSTTHLPLPSEPAGGRKICITTEKNEKLEIDRQIHFYTENTLLTHPLISASLSYLGGLPPLFIIAGDKEVLRDEGIYR
jgi:acetyl esterase/lipase